MLVVMIFILEVVAGALVFVYRGDIEKVLCDELVRGIHNKYPANEDPDENGLKAAWDAVQTTVCDIFFPFILFSARHL